MGRDQADFIPPEPRALVSFPPYVCGVLSVSNFEPFLGNERVLDPWGGDECDGAPLAPPLRVSTGEVDTGLTVPNPASVGSGGRLGET